MDDSRSGGLAGATRRDRRAAEGRGQGGWLVLGKSYQDVNFFTRFRCSGPCQAGVLFRLQKTEAGMTGVYISLADGDLKTYRVTLDAEGRHHQSATRCVRPRRFCAWHHHRRPLMRTPLQGAAGFRWSARAAAADL